MLKLLSESHPNENDLLSLSLDQIARVGAKKLLAEALELEVEEYIERFKEERDKNSGKRLVVRNGRAKPRKITTGAGTIEVKAPRVHDKRPDNQFTSQILPPYMRKSKNVETILPILYLKGLSGNAFHEALCGLLGDDVGGLSSSSISALKKSWKAEAKAWQERSIDDEFVYLWADGVNVKIRLGDDKRLCLLVLVGVNQDGDKKLVALEAGYRESKENWKIVFRDLLKRGMKAPLMIIGDGALGLWSAIDEIEEFSRTKEQKCWVHKIQNVLNKLPKRLHQTAKQHLHEMMKASERSHAEEAKDDFKSEFIDKYPKAVKCVEDNWSELTAFFDLPAIHWQYLRTTNPIESTFATVKLRTRTTKGAGSKEMAEIMAFKLLLEAEKNWRKLQGFKKIPGLLQGDVYKDGVWVDIEKVRGKIA